VHDHSHVEGVEAEHPTLVGVAMEEGEKMEHAHMGKTDSEWQNEGPHGPQANRKNGEA
jgi:hypothetical protein